MRAGATSGVCLAVSEEHPAAGAVAQFLRSWQLLLRLARLYEPNHPRLRKGLEEAARRLEAALRHESPLWLSLDRDGVRLPGQPLTGGEEFKGLADHLLRRGVRAIIFSRATTLRELAELAHLLVAATPAAKSGAASARPPIADGEWNRLLDNHRIRNVRINVPIEQRASAFAATLRATLNAGHVAPAPPTQRRNAPRRANDEEIIGLSREELIGALRLLEGFGTSPQESDPNAPKTALVALPLALVKASAPVTRTLSEAMARHRPDPGELLEPYLRRLAESLFVEFFQEQFEAGKLAAPELRAQFVSMVRELARPNGAPGSAATQALGWFGGRGEEEFSAERLYTQFWAEMPVPTRSLVLRGLDAWCVPINFLRPYLEQLAEAGGIAEARVLLLNYARALESKELSGRLAAAEGLRQLGAVIEKLWPREQPEELCRCLTHALAEERIPEVAEALAGVGERMVRRAFRNADWPSYETILDLLEPARREAPLTAAAGLAGRLLAEERWQGLVNAALAPFARPGSLPRILGRDPERLLDSLGKRLAEPSGPDLLPAMARLLAAMGEPAIGALENRLSDPREQRAALGVKLLAATQPSRLLSALPRVLPSWEWSLQDMAVSELARLGPSDCGRTLLEVLPDAHPLVAPLILDQIGLAREEAATPVLIQIAAGKHERFREIFVRIKAVEALGQMRATEAAEVLRTILRQRNGLMHTEPPGLRAAAAEALGLIENWPSSARVRKAQQALDKSSLAFSRPRRYLRVPLASPLAARIENERAAPARVRTISLGGAFLESRQRLAVGESFPLEIRSGIRRIRGRAVVRTVLPEGGGIEFVQMDSGDRERLRRLVNRLLAS